MYDLKVLSAVKPLDIIFSKEINIFYSLQSVCSFSKVQYLKCGLPTSSMPHFKPFLSASWLGQSRSKARVINKDKGRGSMLIVFEKCRRKELEILQSLRMPPGCPWNAPRMPPGRPWMPRGHLQDAPGTPLDAPGIPKGYPRDTPRANVSG